MTTYDLLFKVPISGEASPDGVRDTEEFFMRAIEPPEFPDCLSVPKEGRTLDDTDECVQLFGSPEYWQAQRSWYSQG